MLKRLIKNSGATLAAVVALHSGSAYATPFVWVDDFDPTNITIGSQLEYTHDIRDGQLGFRPGIDAISSATLNIVLGDDALFGDLPILGDGQEMVSFNFDGMGWTSPAGVGLLDVFDFRLDTLLKDGVIGIAIRATQGDFNFHKSTLVVIGNRTTVPEPASLALFGLGLLGLLTFTCRKLRPSAIR